MGNYDILNNKIEVIVIFKNKRNVQIASEIEESRRKIFAF